MSRSQHLFKTILLSGLLISFNESVMGVVVTGSPPAAQKSGNWSSLKLTWNSPETSPSDTATPIGNGHIGARISGGVAVDTLQLNNKTFWSGGPTSDENSNRVTALNLTRQKLLANDLVGADTAAKNMWGTDPMGVFLPVGNLALSFDNNAGYTAYSRTLDLDQALVTTTYKIGTTNFTRETFASYPDNVIVMRLTSSAAGAITFTAQLSYPTNMEGRGASVTTLGTNVVVMRGKAPYQSNPSEQWGMNKGMTCESRLQILTTGGGVTTNGNALRVTNVTSAILIFANETSWNGPFKEPGTNGVNPTPIVQNTLSNAVAKSYTDLLNAHLANRQNLFRRVWVDINGQSPNAYVLGFQYARQEMISVSRDGERPHNQQGMWNKDWNPTSQGAHWLNENVEKYYSLIEPANLGDCGEPLWNWMQALAIHGTNTAKIDWNFHGWFAPQRSDAWCVTTLQPGNNEWAVWPMGGVWICQNLWEHYAFSGDTNFLATRAYPILKGAAAFVQDLLVDDGSGHLMPSPSTSPENRFALADGTTLAVSMGSTIDLALTRQLFQNCIQAARILNVDSNLSTTLQSNLNRLMPFQISTNLPGELQEWSQDFYRPAAGTRYNPHRHASHIVSVWPLSQITELGTPDLFQAAKLSLINRGSGGYHPDKGAMFARLKDGDRALASNDSFPTSANSLVGKYPPKYAGFAELLLQSHTGAIELLPALPTAFTNGNVSGLRARGGYEVALQWTNRQLAACQIYSPSGMTPLVRYQGALLNLATDARVILTLPPNIPPGPPPGLKATGAAGQVILNWSFASTATGYFIKRGLSSYGPFSLIATNLSGFTFTDTNVINGLTYFYVASSTNSFGEGGNSDPISATPFAPVAAPSGLAAVPVSAYQIKLTWTDNATNEAGFQLERSTNTVSFFIQIAVPAANVTDFSNSGLLPGTTYYYRVRAFNAGTNSGYSAIATATTPAGPPPAPTGLTAVPGDTQATLSWDVTIGAMGYVVKRSSLAGGTYAPVGNTVTASFVDTNLINGITYFYIVAATNSYGQGSDSFSASVTPTDVPEPVAIYELEGNADDTSGYGQDGIDTNVNYIAGLIGAQAAQFNGSSAYIQIPRSIGSNFTVSAWIKTTDTGGAGSQWWSGKGIVDGEVTGSALDWGTAVVNGKFVLGIGTPDTTVASTNSINNSQWHHVAATRTSATGDMRVYVDGLLQGVATGPTGARFAAPVLRIGGIQSSTSKFLNGTIDQVQLYDRVLTPSEIAGLAAVIMQPPAPTNLVATAFDAQVWLHWSEAFGATGYNVKRSPTNGGTYAIVASNWPSLAYTDAGLTNGRLYYYVVSALNAGGESANSIQAAARPVSFTSPQIGVTLNAGQLQLAWPAENTGWRLQIQTNSPDVGLGTSWLTIPNSNQTNYFYVQPDYNHGSVFFRLFYP